MAHLLPLLLAFILNCFGLYVFMEPNNFDCLPFFAYIIFLFSLLLLLWEINIYPAFYRKLRPVALFAIEFAIALCLMELIMNNFWLPLEMAFLNFLQNIPVYLGELMSNLGIKLTMYQVNEFFQHQVTLKIASYAVSLFFLVCVLHGTRIMDLRLLKSDYKEFIDDCILRCQVFLNSFRGEDFNDVYDDDDDNWRPRGRDRRGGRSHVH